jgi:hypothetical protein
VRRRVHRDGNARNPLLAVDRDLINERLRHRDGRRRHRLELRADADRKPEPTRRARRDVRVEIVDGRD